jgi:CRP-like cAMP-binding protein
MSEMGRNAIVLDENAHPFLEKFDTDFLRAASENAYERDLEADDRVFEQGQRAEHFYLVLKGKIGLEIEAPDRPRLTLQTIGPGEVMGWAWLVPPYHWPVDARALKPTRLIVLDTFVLHRYFKLHPDVGYRFVLRLMPVIAKRLDDTRVQLADIHAR